MQRTTRGCVAAVVAAAAMLAASGCTAADAGPEDGAARDDITIGFSVYDMQYEFFQQMEKGTHDAIDARGWKYVLHDEKSDESEMVTGAQALLDQGVDVLIISPFKPDALGPIVAKAKELSIPVIVDDIGGGGTPYDALIISDNEQGGVLAADYMAEQIEALALPTKKVVSITCEPSAIYAARRNDGFRTEIEKLGYTVVTELSGNNSAEDAYQVMKDALAKDPDVSGVFACNDNLAVAATNAIADAGLDPVKDIVTVGFNADPEALAAVKDGSMSATVAQSPRDMGALSVDLAAQILAGDDLQFDNTTDREVLQPVELVTPDNVDDFIE
ncbi:substrate-binding domain-containing protein [Microbacterium jepli]